jgi:hypothetical protein
LRANKYKKGGVSWFEDSQRLAGFAKSEQSGKLSVKSLYADCMNGHTVFLSNYLWKLNVPLKIGI